MAPSSTGVAVLCRALPKAAFPPPPKVALVLSKLDDQRRKHFTQHGLFAFTVHTAAHTQVGMFQWLAAPDDTDLRLAIATRYCDGSLLDRTAGFGIAVVGADGDVSAYGLGWPPSWCATAASAEAWALQVVLENCPFSLDIRTDCQALITAAVAGIATP